MNTNQNKEIICHSCDKKSTEKLITLHLKKQNFNELYNCCKSCFKQLESTFHEMKLKGEFDTVKIIQFESIEVINFN